MNKQQFNDIICEYFDIMDTETRQALTHINEEDQTQVLNKLTSKLYDSIVDKVTEIDFGCIPDTKGDITKLEHYDEMVECCTTIASLLSTYKQDPMPAAIIMQAIDNIRTRKDTFEKAFRYEIEMPMVMYDTLVLSCVSALSYLISCSVEFIKDPSNESFSIAVNKVGAVKTSEALMFKDLEKFNKACAKGDFDKAMDHIISTKIKNNVVGSTSTAVIVIASAAIIGVLLSIIPIMRELIYVQYLARVKMSDYFEVQADLLEMNAANVEANATIDAKKRKDIARRQAKIAENFRKVSNVIEVKSKTANSKAVKEIGSSNQKLKLKDISDQLPDSAGSSLF